MNNSYGFIMSRHVHSEKTNNYWNHAVKNIRRIYPSNLIVIIDDNSDPKFVKSECEYSNLIIIQSEYPKRGELLPYIYYLKYKWFPNAVIIHDSLFFQTKIPFETFNMSVLPFWHYPYDKENINNIIRITQALTNNTSLINKLTVNINDYLIDFLRKNDNFNLCFGCQCYINLDFLQFLEKKYNISNLINVVHNRPDRCSLERIFGLLFYMESPPLKKIHSLFGNISSYPRAFMYSYEDYINDLTINKRVPPVVKVWSGR